MTSTATASSAEATRDLDDWFDLVPCGLVLFDDAGRLLRCNCAVETLLGAAPPATLAAAPQALQLLLWRNDPAALARLAAGAKPLESQVRLPWQGGAPRCLRAVVRAWRPAEQPGRYMAVIEDCSAEEERDLAQAQIATLTDAAGVGLATFQESSGWVAMPAAGRTAAPAALQSIGRDLVRPDSRPAFDRVQEALRDGRRVEARYAIRHPELGLRWLLTRVEPATLASGRRVMSVVTLDVTEREAAQRRGEELLRELSTILESTSAGIAYVRGRVLVRCNRRFEQFAGIAAGWGSGRSVDELFLDRPHLRRIARNTLRALAARPAVETELEGRLPADMAWRPRWFSLSVRRVDASAQAAEGVDGVGAGVEAIVVLTDVTRLKSQQQEFEALARDRALMFDLSEVGIAFVRHGRVRRANQALAALTGLGVDELTDLPHEALFADSDGASDEGALLRFGRWGGERRLRRGDGTLLWVQVSLRLVADGDPAAGAIVSYVNVDARRRAEAAVALHAERTRTILNSVLVGIVTVGARGIEWMNRSARRMFGGDLGDFLDQPIATVATPEPDHPLRRAGELDGLADGESETFECRLKARDGREFWVVGNVVATGGGTSNRQLTYALLDIERRRQAEARVAESQDSLQRLIELAPLAITVRDARTLRVLQINQAAAAIVRRPVDELVGSTPEEMYAPDVARNLRADMQEALAAGAVTRREYVWTSRSGRTTLAWDARYLPIGPAGQPPEQLLLVATDVSEQRAAQEARFAAAVAQREMLVKEVHHRIKNNLQGVAGLLRQIGERKPEVAPAIGEAVGQLQAIAQVYGLQVGAGGPLALDGVVEAITGSVQRLFGQPIALAVEGARWLLPEAESIPIALTLNELLTNAIKHSAPPRPDAPAGVTCRLSGDDDGVSLVVANDGRLPEGFSLARFPGGVSGLGLVRALLPRRSARLDLEQHGDRVRASLRLTPPGVVRP